MFEWTAQSTCSSLAASALQDASANASACALSLSPIASQNRSFEDSTFSWAQTQVSACGWMDESLYILSGVGDEGMDYAYTSVLVVVCGASAALPLGSGRERATSIDSPSIYQLQYAYGYNKKERCGCILCIGY